MLGFPMWPRQTISRFSFSKEPETRYIRSRTMRGVYSKLSMIARYTSVRSHTGTLSSIQTEYWTRAWSAW